LVTGATGFIGRRLIKRLIDDGFTPHAFVLPGDAVPIEWGDTVQIHYGDVAHRSSVAKAMKGIATLFHLAAMVGDWGSEADHQRVTVRGTENMLGEAARHDVRVLLASSVVIYGGQIGMEVCDEQRPMGQAMGPYSRAKQEQERIARRLEASHSLKVTVIRPTNVYGPGSVPWVDKVVEALHAAQPMLIGDGRKDAALTYVDNVVDVFVRAARHPPSIGRVYNASDDNNITWLRYFTELAVLIDAPKPKSLNAYLAAVAARGAETAFRLLRKRERPPITREALNLVGSHHRVPITRARKDLGYEPAVGYKEAMAQIGNYLERS
jgi:nucleoside-diphosphate-sugar epimerase